MTQYTRTISRQVTNALPAWRQAMVDTDKVYEIGAAPTGLSATISWPAAGSSSLLMNNGGDNNPWRLHKGYGGSVFVPELGAHGSMVFGSTGEATISNQLTAFPLSDDAPAWEWFQQPDYPISEAEATTADADMYYSEADYAGPPAGGAYANEAALVSGWDGTTFPIGYANWIIRRKLTDSLTGNSRPWFFRYEMPRYIPPAMTGTANGAIVVTSMGTIYGPFSQGPKPSGIADADWFADVWGSGRRKHYLWAMDVVTKVWTRLADPIPDFALSFDVVMLPLSFVDEATSRIYYWVIASAANALFYADCSSGLAGMTVSSPEAMTDTSGGAAPNLKGNSVICAITTGTLSGKRLFFCKDSGATPAVLMIEPAANTMRKLTITGLPAEAHFWGFSYDAALNRVHITTKHTSNGMRRFTFPIPDSYTSAGAYTVTETVLDTSGVTLEDTDAAPFQGGERTQLGDLGVVKWTQWDSKMLAYVPGA